MVTCQSANQLKTPAKVSWAFKMFSQFGSLGYTIMGKTADLTVVQKTNIDTLHKEDKPQTCIAKEAVHRVLYPSMLTESWVEGKSVEKRCSTNRENRSFMRIVKQNRFKNLGELHKEWTESGVKASRAPHTDVSRNLATVVVRGVLPGLRRRRTSPKRSKVLFSDTNTNYTQMSFICHIHNYTEYNEQWNVFSVFNPSKWSSGQPMLRRPGSSWGFGALPKGLISVVDTSCQSQDSNPQPWVTSGFKSNALSIRPRLPPDESIFCNSFGNQGPRVWRKRGEAHSPSCLKSSVKFPQSVMIWGAMSSAGVGPLCFF